MNCLLGFGRVLEGAGPYYLTRTLVGHAQYKQASV